jgi:hypothetical protein
MGSRDQTADQGLAAGLGFEPLPLIKLAMRPNKAEYDDCIVLNCV